MPAKLALEIPRSKLYVDLIRPYKYVKNWIEHLIIEKSVTMIGPVTGQFEITEYNKNKSMNIVNLVETMWLLQYPWPVEMM